MGEYLNSLIHRFTRILANAPREINFSMSIPCKICHKYTLDMLHHNGLICSFTNSSVLSCADRPAARYA